MSMISSLCAVLEYIAHEMDNDDEWIVIRGTDKKEWAYSIKSAIDTIKTQSEKLHAYAMERSSQYYHDGWIPCSEGLPSECEYVLFQTHDGLMQIGQLVSFCPDFAEIIVAWRPLPTPYKREDTE